MWVYLVAIVAMIGMMYFTSRGQKKQQQERQNLLNAMKPGDSAITAGGLHGVVSEIDTEKGTVILDCEGIYLEFERNSIRSVTPNVAVDAAEETVIEETISEEDTTEE
ncbi:preprotein translocase subunit YajC [Enterococcus sp. PF1-24]|uniref:preprotein translocase subunit YajC n=1 Tax=unclassified Enterococcus TaxID=2608891 RepID=UPI00247301B6|nr:MULTISPECIES: preprotein translocase subunit YajC [unclassified Enterococcus]MDH6363449.1 preprotein translocase subunit YajC [Enterococcus sp. PFB1-1]MDH6400543.1 preprotein translocase subunit YajC [Enterococcus sp. PF1-24]